MRRREHDDVVEVELVEGDEPFHVVPTGGYAAAAPAVGQGAHLEGVPGPEAVAPPHGPRRRRALWWVGTAVLLALVGSGVVANVVAAREEAERREALAGLPWVLPDLSGGLEEVWRVDGSWVDGEVDGALYVSGASTFGGGFAAVDPRTGSVLWEAPVGESGYCYLPWSWGSYSLSGGVTDTPPDVVLCDVLSVPSDGGIADSVTVSVDARTGERLAELTGTGAPIMGGFAVDGDYVTVTSSEEGEVVVVRQTMRTGAAVWEYRSEPGLVENLASDVGWTLGGSGDQLVIGGVEPLVLSLDTGQVEEPRGGGVEEYVFPLVDGSSLELRFGADGSDIVGTVLEPDGSARFDFTGYPWIAQYGDSTGAGVLLVQEVGTYGVGAVVALDLGTGEEVWRDDDLAQTGGAVLMLGDVALAVEQDGLVAIDMTTGRVLWTRAELAAYTYPTIASDGRVAVFWMHDSTDGSRFVGLDLRTGEERWTQPAPDGVTTLRPSIAGVLLAITDREVIAFRP